MIERAQVEAAQASWGRLYCRVPFADAAKGIQPDAARLARPTMRSRLEAVRSVAADLLRRGADALSSLAEDDAEALGGPAIGPDTLKYMSELANDSFKRQLELDESVWRSLPFFAATFAFIAAVAGRAATDTPPLSWSTLSLVSHAFLVLAFGSLAWALRWFVPILRKRDYEYPSSDAEVNAYAKEMNAYHAALGKEGDDLDAEVLEELRHFMIDQHGSAARTNFLLNGTRMAARSKALLFMLTSFVLAFLCEATIFIHRDVTGPSEVGYGAAKRQELTDVGADGPVYAGSADSAEEPSGHGRRELLGNQVEAAAGAGEGRVTKTPPKRPAGNVQAPNRPVPPSPQFMAKRASEFGYTYDDRHRQPAASESSKATDGKKKD